MSFTIWTHKTFFGVFFIFQSFIDLTIGVTNVKLFEFTQTLKSERQCLKNKNLKLMKHNPYNVYIN